MEKALKVLAASDSNEWEDAWQRLPSRCRDVFALPGYLSAFSLAEPGARPECAVMDLGGRVLLYPYLRRRLSDIGWLRVPEEACDIMTAYGYGGIYGLEPGEHLPVEFLEAFSGHCRSSGVVAELIRLNPLVMEPSFLPPEYGTAFGNLQVVVDLRKTELEIWQGYKHNNRKNIAKAQRNGVVIVREEYPGTLFPAFREIYESTMNRRGADSSFVFGPEFYDRLLGSGRLRSVLFYALIDGRPVSTELALCSETAVYSFLGGTVEEFFQFRPNNLLKHELIFWARGAGFEKYLIGGGPSGQDGIYEFKRSFAPDGVIQFSLAWRIHDQELYGDLLAQCASHPPHSGEAASRYPLRWRYSGS